MDHETLTLTRLRLTLTPGVGPRTAHLLEERLGLERAFDRDALRAHELPERIVRALSDPKPAAAARALLDRLRTDGVRVIPLGGPGYPPALAAIADPPQALTVRGAFDPAEHEDVIAIVGARRADPPGLDLTAELAGDLAAAGFAVVSGLARGVDAAAHAGALAVGGVTWAVLPGGLDRVYPRGNLGLAQRIAARGALISELPPDHAPRRHDFPRRNRIVTGLSQAVVVVQAGPRSGALISAEFALQQGRELFAVPGAPRDPLAQGTNALIRDGATLVTCAQDVLDQLLGVQTAPPPPPGSVEARVLDALDARAARDLEALAARSGLAVEQVMVGLGRLELAGHVRATPAGFRVART